MKFKQNSETGKLQVYLNVGKEPDAEKQLQVLTDFVSEQSVTIFRLVNSYRKIKGRLDNIEAQLNQELEYQVEQRKRQE